MSTLTTAVIASLQSSFGKFTNGITLINDAELSPTLVGELNYALDPSGGAAALNGAPLAVVVNVGQAADGASFNFATNQLVISISGSASTLSLDQIGSILGSCAHEVGHAIDDYFYNSSYYETGESPTGAFVDGIDGEVRAVSYETIVDNELLRRRRTICPKLHGRGPFSFRLL